MRREKCPSRLSPAKRTTWKWAFTNDVFPQARDETPACNQGVNEPNDIIRTDKTDARNQAFNNPLHEVPDWFGFALFMRFLDGPQPVEFSPTAQRGQQLFGTDVEHPGIGCFLCHTPMMVTGSRNETEALQNWQVRLYSDLLLHHMGAGLADNVTQGKRMFFLHDGRTSDLLEAIEAHVSNATTVNGYPPSEAAAVIRKFEALPVSEKQAILEFLRSL